MQRNYKSTSKESAFTSPAELSDSPLSAEVSLLNTMKIKSFYDFPNYYATREGDVFSKNYGQTGVCGRMKAHLSYRGYLYVQLQNKKLVKKFYIHRIVAEVFIPNPLNLPCVNHKDFNKENNYVSNLEWCTAKENAQHALKGGHYNPWTGEDSERHILTELQVLQIREMHIPKKMPFARIAKLYNVGTSTIANIIYRNSWKQI